MSEQGVGAAVMLTFIIVIGFLGTVATAVLYDLHRLRQGGEAATETDGVRWLTRHMPWLVAIVAGFLWGALMFAAGFLCCHFWGVPLYQP